MQETLGPGLWPWISLAAAIIGFVLGMLFGRPRTLASWGGKKVCGTACDCLGIPCWRPVGPGQRHTHCPNQGTEPTGCNGTCTKPPAHAGTHTCSHGHAF